MFRLLVVDSDHEFLASSRSFLEANGLAVDTASSGDEAIAKVSANRFRYALVILNGAAESSTVETLRGFNPDLFILVRSGDESRPNPGEDDIGRCRVINEGVAPEQLLVEVGKWCVKFEQTYEAVASACDISESVGLSGHSPVTARVSQMVLKIAPTDLSVCIQGEAGVDKEAVAKGIHRHSRRSRHELVIVDCASLTPSLLETELFGCIRGSRASTVEHKTGLVRLAHKGTLFLNEIGSARSDLQAKLLRLREEGTYTPAGSRHTYHADVRLITATSRDLEHAVRLGDFRTDLFYRINELEINVPPLRARPGDIEPLVAHYCRHWSEKHGREKTFLKRTIAVLRQYAWPGNERELRRFVDRVLTSSPKDKIAPEDLEPEYFTPPASAPTAELSLKEKQEELEKDVVARAFRATKNFRDAAVQLGMSPTSVFRKVKKYGITKESGEKG